MNDWMYVLNVRHWTRIIFYCAYSQSKRFRFLQFLIVEYVYLNSHKCLNLRLLSKFVTVCLTATDILNNMGYYSLIQLPPKRTSITKTLPFQEQLEKMAETAALENFHNNIRTLAQTKRIRVTEFFQDFDKLRSGFVTGNQQKKTIIHCIIGTCI